MGVPSYFRWLVRHFEDDIISNECPFEVVHQLYLDFNGGIHPAVRSMPESSIDAMYEAVLKYLKYIIDLVKPTELIYIAIDGVAPLAKMKQQRIRRFKAVKEVVEINQLKKQYGVAIDEKNQKDFNMISPATQFMTDLSDKIQKFLVEHKSGQYKHLKIIFVDATVPGEGEHKILKYIKTQPMEKNCLIYGLDSDLIFLSMSTKKDNIALIRENTLLKNNNMNVDDGKFPEMSYFLISGLSHHIINILNPYTSLAELEGLKIFSVHDKGKNTGNTQIIEMYERMKAEEFFTKPEDMQNVIRDYIFMSFMLGNDFIPSVEALKIRDGGIEQILRAYKIVIQKRRQYLLTNEFKINVEFFFELIQILSESEQQLLKNQKKSRDRRIRSKDPMYKPQNYADALDEYQCVEHLYTDEINVFRDGWENRYYSYFFHIKTAEVSQKKANIEQICEDYIQALQWITQYYFNDCADWHWYYQHEATPLLSDLATYLSVYPDKVNAFNFIKHEPVEPYHQLLIILPPQSSHLLPKPFTFVMTADESPIIQYYPIDFSFEYYGKRYKWECHPKVPMINPTELNKYLAHIKDKLTSIERDRNQVGLPIEF